MSPFREMSGGHDTHVGIVVGEAARVGDHVTIMQHVTLGGTGNEPGDRHPKIGNHVQIGVKATILGKAAHYTSMHSKDASQQHVCILPYSPSLPTLSHL